MTDSLGNILRRTGCLEKLSKEAEWDTIVENVCHILTGALEALKHLASLNMQHCDVKASNILIRKHKACPCQDVLHCKCPEERKCEVKLADFDSLKESQFPRDVRGVPYKSTPKTPEQVKKIMGTIGHRAPEVCVYR